MKVLVAYECSGRVREAFRALGHDAWSCDQQPAEDGSPFHIQGDAVEAILYGDWDLVIAHPPCTDIAVSGAAHFAAKRADGRQQRGIDLFMATVRACEASVPRWAIENPVCIMSSLWRKPDQIIQPYEFGDPEAKKTCLWLKGLSLLKPTSILPLPSCGYWRNQTPSGQNKLGPSPDRAKKRATTYQGIADAMAEQWGGRA